MRVIPRVVAMLLMAAAPVRASAMTPMESDARYDFYYIPSDIERHEAPRDAALPLSAPVEGQENYATQQEAMAAAAHAVIAVSTDYESGGAIYQEGASYHFSAPVTADRTTEIDYRVALPHGATLVALFHSHPGHTGTASDFSDSDKVLQAHMHLPLYVLVIDAHAVIGLGAPGFALDVAPVEYPTIEVAGITYRIVSDHGSYLLLERAGRQFIYHKPKAV